MNDHAPHSGKGDDIDGLQYSVLIRDKPQKQRAEPKPQHVTIIKGGVIIAPYPNPSMANFMTRPDPCCGDCDGDE